MIENLAGKLVCGLDEAGRGALVGDVVAAAVILDPNKPIEGLNDSKKLSPKKREKLYAEITEKALAYAIVSVDHNKIDEINILRASLLAMQLAVKQLKVKPDLLLVDGNQVFEAEQKIEAIVGGDAKVLEIAAASILAKVYRDRQMLELDKKYPEYLFAKHKGYPTVLHLAKLAEFGVIDGYRLSYKPVRLVLENIKVSG